MIYLLFWIPSSLFFFFYKEKFTCQIFSPIQMWVLVLLEWLSSVIQKSGCPARCSLSHQLWGFFCSFVFLWNYIHLSLHTHDARSFPQQNPVCIPWMKVRGLQTGQCGCLYEKNRMLLRCLYIPCRTEFVWYLRSHRFDSRGIYGRCKNFTFLLMVRRCKGRRPACLTLEQEPRSSSHFNCPLVAHPILNMLTPTAQRTWKKTSRLVKNLRFRYHISGHLQKRWIKCWYWRRVFFSFSSIYLPSFQTNIGCLWGKNHTFVTEMSSAKELIIR